MDAANTTTTRGGLASGASTAPSSAAKSDGASSQVDKYWTAIARLVLVQLGCSLLMQLSYVAFPAYNFALALWGLACCTPKWIEKNPRLLPLHLFAVAASVVTDVVWMSLWVSGRVFYDQFCGQNGVSLVSCGGPTEHFPGCHTNRFALFTLVVNDLAKVATLVAVYRVRTLAGPPCSSSNHHHHHHHHAHAADDAVATASANTHSAVHQMPTQAPKELEP